MFYRPGIDPHGLAHNPYKAIVSPRPIAWISSKGKNGHVNLAPYSYFNIVSENPIMVVFGSSGGKPDRENGKDTLSNIRETGEFVVNIVSYALRDAMNKTSDRWSADTDEFAIAGLEKAASRMVDVPRVARSPAALECRLWKIIALPGEHESLVIAQVEGIHIDDAFIRDGKLDVTLYQPLARLGYHDYSAVENIFELTRPGS